MTKQIALETSTTKDVATSSVEAYITQQGYEIVDADKERPWGAFFRIKDDQIEQFIQQYFSADPILLCEAKERKMSPKFLLVAPKAELSLQYHYRRDEEWVGLVGPVLVNTGSDASQLTSKTLEEHERISLKQGQVHQLVGLENWGVVVEIWKHTDPNNPSNEDDIVRVHDKYGRTSPIAL